MHSARYKEAQSPSERARIAAYAELAGRVEAETGLSEEALMLVTVGLLLAGGVGLCLLYKSDRERSWLLALVSVAVGLVLLTMPELDGIAVVLAGHLIDWTRMAAEKAAPFLLLVALVVALWWLGRRWWKVYRAFGPVGRGRVLLFTISLGVVIAALLRIAPYLSDAARVAGEGARAGWDAGIDKALDEAGDGADLNGGGAPP